jgi:hypothetical protein
VCTIADLRRLFVDPPASSRPMAILHGLGAMLKRRAKIPPDVNWSPPEDVCLLHDSLTDALVRIKEWGFGGIVTNVGWTNYLRDEDEWRIFLEGVRVCRNLGLRVWVYDELGYPSGTAGGLVLKGHPDLEAEVLVRSVVKVTGGRVEVYPPTDWRYSVYVRADDGSQTYDLSDNVGADGVLRWTAPGDCTIERYDVRSGFNGTHATRNVHAYRRYINVLDPRAIKRFYKLTYQQYVDRLGSDIQAIEAFFTDEPSFMAAYFPDIPEQWKSHLRVDDEPAEEFDRLPQLPWRKDLPERFKRRYHYDLLPNLASLFGGESDWDFKVRHDFHQLVSRIYAKTFFRGLQASLANYGIPLSGHVLAEELLVQHVASEGNLMWNLMEMEEPGIDMLTALPENILGSASLLTCKYGSSSAHICGRRDVMSEVSDFSDRVGGRATTIDQRRGALAVQSALGITTFTSYFSWKGMDPEAVRQLMTFCGRIYPAVRFGTHVAHVAILYPIRTAWVHYVPTSDVLSPDSQPGPLASLDGLLLEIAHGLLQNQVDFDFVESRTLLRAGLEPGGFEIAGETYELLIIPPATVLSSAEMRWIRRFARCGGKILAFEPLSEVRLSTAKSGLTAVESAGEVIAKLASQFKETVKVQSIEDNWTEFVISAVSRDLVLRGSSEWVVVRQSRLSDGDVFLVANASSEPAEFEVLLEGLDRAELWHPVDGTIKPLPSKIVVEGYGAVLIVRRRNSNV